jgi:hypothetical protein
MRIALVVLVPALCAGLASSAWADKDKDKGHGRGHGPPGQTVIVPQPVRVIVPDRDRTTVYTYYRTVCGYSDCEILVACSYGADILLQVRYHH